jgi:hypothetical protein
VTIRHFAAAAGGGGAAAAQVHADTGFVTSGDVSATSGAFTQVGPDLTIDAAAGDVLVLEPDILCTTGADTQFEAATRVSGADNRWWSTGTTSSRWPGGLAGWYVETGSQKPGTPERYTVNADDVVNGQVTVRLYARSTGATRTVQANASYPARWALYNLGPAAA